MILITRRWAGFPGRDLFPKVNYSNGLAGQGLRGGACRELEAPGVGVDLNWLG